MSDSLNGDLSGHTDKPTCRQIHAVKEQSLEKKKTHEDESRPGDPPHFYSPPSSCTKTQSHMFSSCSGQEASLQMTDRAVNKCGFHVNE